MAPFQKSISYGGEVEWHHSRSQSGMVMKWNDIITLKQSAMVESEVEQIWRYIGMASFPWSIIFGFELEWHHS